jgi:hypothetical protein
MSNKSKIIPIPHSEFGDLIMCGYDLILLLLASLQRHTDYLRACGLVMHSSNGHGFDSSL